MAIDAQHPQYTKYSDKWKLITDIVCQENVENYLIELNPDDDSQQNKTRNDNYKERALFYALTGETVNGMVGTMFNKLPEFEANDALMYLADNVDGRGNSIYQQSQKVAKNVTSVSRDGLYVSYPKTGGQVSKADISSGLAVATIQEITADRIINWREESIGSKSWLTLIVFTDTIIEYVDYEQKETPSLRELYIENFVYKERIWIKPENTENWIVQEELTPTGNNGNALTEIPFQFVGAVNNDADVDNPNMLGLSHLNIAHYRNSADFEDSVWYAGQAQPYMSGVTETHINLMTENNMYVGSRNLIAVPDGGSFGFASAQPNPVVRQAMIDKVDMMIGIGARMITPGGVAKTAEQSANERATQHSTMSLVAENVSDAYVSCLKWIGVFMGVDTTEAIYQISTDFIDPEATPQELKEMIMGFLSSAIPLGDYVRYMKDYGVFDEEKPIEEYEAELNQVQMPDLDNG